MAQQRRGKSLISHSFDYVTKNIEMSNRNTKERRKAIKLEDMLRNNVEEKTFLEFALLTPDLKGVKGRGG